MSSGLEQKWFSATLEGLASFRLLDEGAAGTVILDTEMIWIFTEAVGDNGDPSVVFGIHSITSKVVDPSLPHTLGFSHTLLPDPYSGAPQTLGLVVSWDNLEITALVLSWKVRLEAYDYGFSPF